MENKKFGLITEAFGHGFFALNACQVLNLIPVAFSDKEKDDEREAHVAQIKSNFDGFVPEWGNPDEVTEENSVNLRKELLAGNFGKDFWERFAESTLTPTWEPDLPAFRKLDFGGYINTMFVPQKLISDGMCGTTAAQQSLPNEIFDFLVNEEYRLILGQNFNKVTDLEKLEEFQKHFPNAYIPGQTEDKTVFGIRGIAHKMYLNLYDKLDLCVGVAGTHTWYILTCFPQVPQVILYNKGGVEDWAEIAEAYRKAGYNIRAIGFDAQSDMVELKNKILQAIAER